LCAFLFVVVGLCLTSMLAATMGSAPHSSGQESLKSGRRKPAVSCTTHRCATSPDTVGPGDDPAAAQLGFNR
jgi:hypothetical protein